MHRFNRMLARSTLFLAFSLVGQLGWSQIEIERVSISSEGAQSSDIARAASISDDGNIVTFTAVDDSLAPGYSNPFDFGFSYFRVMDARQTEWVSIPTSVSRFPILPTVSGDGSRIYFVSNESQLPGIEDPGSATNRLFSREMTTGAIQLALDTATSGCVGIDTSTLAVSGNGTKIVFKAPQCFVIENGNTEIQALWIYDSISNIVTLISRNLDAMPISVLNGHAISNNGQWVYFSTVSQVDGLGPENSNIRFYAYEVGSNTNVFLNIPDSSVHGSSLVQAANITDDGRFVTFRSREATLVENDTNGREDIFLFDRVSEQIDRISLNSDGSQVMQSSFNASMTPTADRIVYVSAGKMILWERDHDRRFNLLPGVQARGLEISSNGRYVIGVVEDSQIDGEDNGVPDVVRIDLDRVYFLFSDSFELQES